MSVARSLRKLLPSLLCVVALCTQSSAAAQSSDCRAVASFEQLSRADRDALYELCEQGGPVSFDQPPLKRIINAHVVNGDVSGLALFRVFQPRAAATPDTHLSAGKLATAFEAQSRRPDQHVPAIAPASERCLVIDTNYGELEGVLSFGGEKPGIAELRPLKAGTAGEGVHYHYACFPRRAVNAAFSIRPLQGDRTSFATVVGLSKDPLGADWLEVFMAARAERESYAAEIEILHDAPAGSEPLVLLDGLPVEMEAVDAQQLQGKLRLERLTQAQSRFTVDPNERVHALSVVGLGEAGQPVVLAQRTVSLQELRFAAENGVAKPIRYDLRSIAGAYRGILEVDADPQCVHAGLDVARLREAVLHVFGAAAPRPLGKGVEAVRDLQSWQGNLQGLAELRDALSSLGGAPVGAARGRLDLVAAMGEAGQDLLRQGMKRLTSLYAHCSQNADGTWSYAISGHEMNLEQLLQRPRDYLAGIDLTEIITNALEVETSLSSTRTALERIAATLSGVPMVELRSLAKTSSVRDPITARVRISVPTKCAAKKATVRVRVARLSESDADVCRSFEEYGALRDGHAPRVPSGGYNHDWALTLEPGIGETSLSLQSLGTGTHVVSVRLEAEHGGAEALEDVGCIEVVDSSVRFRLSGAAHGAPEKLNAYYPMRDENYRQYRWTLSVPFGDVGFEAVAGYAYTLRHGKGPSTWNDLHAVDEVDQDAQAYSVREHTLLFGIGFGGELNACKDLALCGRFGRAVGLMFNTTAAFAGAIVDVSNVPAELRDFRGTRPGDNWQFAPDVAAILGLGPRFRLSKNTIVDLGVEFMIPKVYGMLRKVDENRTRARFSAVMSIGAFVSVGRAQ